MHSQKDNNDDIDDHDKQKESGKNRHNTIHRSDESSVKG